MNQYSQITKSYSLLIFYRTDLGQLMLSKMPLLMQESMLLSRQEIQAIMPEIKSLTVEMVEELKARKGLQQ